MATIKSIEQKAKAYDKALKVLHKYDGANIMFSQSLKEEMFPELAESEDEKIRKEIITHCRNTRCVTEEGAERIAKWLAWLEKQGEQKATIIIPKFRVGDEIKTSNEESLTVTKIDEKGYWSGDLFICGFDDAAKWELVEQKPAWSEEDETVLNNLIYALANDRIGNDRDEYISYLKSLKDRVQPQTKQVWSDEEEDVLEDIEEAIINYWHGDTQDILLDWLESLKDRYTWKPKQEWSENDENIIVKIKTKIAQCNGFNKKNREEVFGLIDSLRPHNHWKPSDEQMKALLKLEEMHVLEHEKNQENAHLYMMVKSIREQLLKLREE